MSNVLINSGMNSGIYSIAGAKKYKQLKNLKIQEFTDKLESNSQKDGISLSSNAKNLINQNEEIGASKSQVNTLLNQAASKYGIPVNILKAVAWQESKFNSEAKSFDGGHGKGVMQIDDRYHQFASTSKVWDASQNIDYGARYLRQLYDQTGDWNAALRAYNGGGSYPSEVMRHAQTQPWNYA